MYRRVENRARRLQEMMQRLDIDAGVLARLRSGDAYAEARSRCLFCGTGDKCLRLLEQSGEGARPEFCPNLALFESCRRKDTPDPAR
jgi:hypothetical protein